MFKGRLSGWKVSNANTRYMFANASSFDAEKKGLFGPDCRTEWDLSAPAASTRAGQAQANSDCVNVDVQQARTSMPSPRAAVRQGILSDPLSSSKAKKAKAAASSSAAAARRRDAVV